MKLSDIIKEKNMHLDRLSNQTGSEGEALVIEALDDLVPRPKGKKLKNLLSVLEKTGIIIKKSSFDALSCPQKLDLSKTEEIARLINDITFVEIKTTKKKSVTDDFSGYFFALTESELLASEQLGERHKVVLYNKNNKNLLVTSVPKILKRVKSKTWQVSVQI